MKVWSVDHVHTPWVGHGYEPVAFFSTKERAEAYRDRLLAQRTPEEAADPEKYGYGWEVDEWEVDPAWAEEG